MKHQSCLIEIVTVALQKAEINMSEEEIQFFTEMFENTFMSDIKIDRKTEIKNLPASISSIFDAETYEYFLTEYQLDRIDSLVTNYPKIEDQENKLPYHLRPQNMVKTIRFA